MIREIEDAILQQLQLMGVFKKVAPFHAEDVERLLQQVRTWPAAFVVYTGSRTVAEDFGRYHQELFYTVLIATKSLRGEVVAQSRPGRGVYNLLEAVYQKLAGATGEQLGIPEMVDLKPREDRALLLEQGRVIFGLEFQARVYVPREV